MAGTERPDAGIVAANVGVGAVIGGVGALVNGTDDGALERFGRGALRGGAGGAGLYAGKWLGSRVYHDSTYAWAWPAAIVHEVGASVVENAAQDRPPLERLSFHVAFVRLDVRPAERQVGARLLPFNALAFGLMASRHRLDVRRSLATGTPLFTGPDNEQVPFGFLPETGAWAFLNTVYLQGDVDDWEITSHELNHVLQHREWMRMNTWLGPLNRALGENEAYRWVGSVVYLDNPMWLAGAYFLGPGGCKDDVWLEHEAQLFVSRGC